MGYSSWATLNAVTQGDFVKAPTTITLSSNPDPLEVDLLPTITVTGFATQNGSSDNHIATRYTIVDSADGTIMWSAESTTNLLSITMTGTPLLPSTDYKCIVAFKGAIYGWGASATKLFLSENIEVLAPVVTGTYPDIVISTPTVDNGTGTETFTMEFKITDSTGALVAEITGVPYTSNVDLDSIHNFEPDTLYTVCIRLVGSISGASDYTCNTIHTPTVIHPVCGLSYPDVQLSAGETKISEGCRLYLGATGTETVVIPQDKGGTAVSNTVEVVELPFLTGAYRFTMDTANSYVRYYDSGALRDAVTIRAGSNLVQVKCGSNSNSKLFAVNNGTLQRWRYFIVGSEAIYVPSDNFDILGSSTVTNDVVQFSKDVRNCTANQYVSDIRIENTVLSDLRFTKFGSTYTITLVGTSIPIVTVSSFPGQIVMGKTVTYDTGTDTLTIGTTVITTDTIVSDTIVPPAATVIHPVCGLSYPDVQLSAGETKISEGCRLYLGATGTETVVIPQDKGGTAVSNTVEVVELPFLTGAYRFTMDTANSYVRYYDSGALRDAVTIRAGSNNVKVKCGSNTNLFAVNNGTLQRWRYFIVGSEAIYVPSNDFDILGSSTVANDTVTFSKDVRNCTANQYVSDIRIENTVLSDLRFTKFGNTYTIKLVGTSIPIVTVSSFSGQIVMGKTVTYDTGTDTLTIGTTVITTDTIVSDTIVPPAASIKDPTFTVSGELNNVPKNATITVSQPVITGGATLQYTEWDYSGATTGSGVISDTGNIVATTPDLTNNSSYTIRVRYVASGGLVSNWVAKSVTTNYSVATVIHPVCGLSYPDVQLSAGETKISEGCRLYLGATGTETVVVQQNIGGTAVSNTVEAVELPFLTGAYRFTMDTANSYVRYYDSGALRDAVTIRAGSNNVKVKCGSNTNLFAVNNGTLQRWRYFIVGSEVIYVPSDNFDILGSSTDTNDTAIFSNAVRNCTANQYVSDIRIEDKTLSDLRFTKFGNTYTIKLVGTSIPIVTVSSFSGQIVMGKTVTYDTGTDTLTIGTTVITTDTIVS